MMITMIYKHKAKVKTLKNIVTKENNNGMINKNKKGNIMY